MKNLPVIRGLLEAADTIMGNLGGVVVLIILGALAFSLVGYILYAFFKVTNFFNIGIEAAGVMLIMGLTLVAIFLVATIVSLSRRK